MGMSALITNWPGIQHQQLTTHGLMDGYYGFNLLVYFDVKSERSGFFCRLKANACIRSEKIEHSFHSLPQLQFPVTSCGLINILNNKK